MKTWNQCILNTILAKGANAYGEIGEFTIRKGAKYIVGFYSSIVNAKPTADEASTPYIKIESSAYDISGVQQHGGPVGAEGMAAHQSSLVKKVWNPFSVPLKGKDGGTIKFYVASVVACTEGWECGIQLVTSDRKPTEFEKLLYLIGKGDVYSDADIAYEAAGAGDSDALAPWGTGNADMIVVNGKNNRTTGLAYTLGLNAETANTGIVNYAELTCSDITDFTPQQHLCNFGVSGALGTVIDAIKEMPVDHLPFIFDGLPSSMVKIAISDISSITGFTAADGLLSMQFA